MRRILASAMLALTLAGGIMAFTVSVQAQPHHRNCSHGLEGEHGEDTFPPC
jgi:hypothetical protein